MDGDARSRRVSTGSEAGPRRIDPKPSILLACRVRMAMVFGVLTFLLNFIPNIGSIIAQLLPVPIVILDDNLSLGVKLIAIFGP